MLDMRHWGVEASYQYGWSMDGYFLIILNDETLIIDSKHFKADDQWWVIRMPFSDISPNHAIFLEGRWVVSLVKILILLKSWEIPKSPWVSILLSHDHPFSLDDWRVHDQGTPSSYVCDLYGIFNGSAPTCSPKSHLAWHPKDGTGKCLELWDHPIWLLFGFDWVSCRWAVNNKKHCLLMFIVCFSCAISRSDCEFFGGGSECKNLPLLMVVRRRTGIFGRTTQSFIPGYGCVPVWLYDIVSR